MHNIHFDYLEQFKQNRVDGGQEIMLEARLENAIDVNFISFDKQNDRKQKEFEVRFDIISGRYYKRLYYNYFFVEK